MSPELVHTEPCICRAAYLITRQAPSSFLMRTRSRSLLHSSITIHVKPSATSLLFTWLGQNNVSTTLNKLWKIDSFDFSTLLSTNLSFSKLDSGIELWPSHPGGILIDYQQSFQETIKLVKNIINNPIFSFYLAAGIVITESKLNTCLCNLLSNCWYQSQPLKALFLSLAFVPISTAFYEFNSNHSNFISTSGRLQKCNFFARLQ